MCPETLYVEVLPVLKTARETFSTTTATRKSPFDQRFRSPRPVLGILMATPKLAAMESLHGSTVTVADMLDVIQTSKVSLLL